MKYLLAIGLLICATSSIFAQASSEPNIKFGEVSLEELQMKFYPKDSTAEAVVLYEKGATGFLMNFMSSNGTVTNSKLSMLFSYHLRLKILKKSAFSRGDYTAIPFEGAY